MEQTWSSMIEKEAMAGRNVTILLNGNEAYSPTCHKMMKGMLGSGLLTCVVYRYNGKPKLLYFTGDKKPLSAVGTMEGSQVLSIAKSFVNAAEQLYSAGSLNLGNVLVSGDRVYVDMNSLNCYFMFLPLNNGGAGLGRERFEAQVMTLLRSFVVRYSADGTPKLQKLIEAMSGPGVGIHQIKQFFAAEGPENDPPPTNQGIRFVGVGTPVVVDIAITKPEFIIGKNVNGVDGTISFNNAISRVHCKIIRRGGKIYIADLGSSNGTYINGKKLTDGQAAQVRIGDRIRLANSNFELREGK